MKDFLQTVGVMLGVLIFVGAMFYGLRSFNSAVTPITVYEVEPDVKCATMVTADGVALDCWILNSRSD